MSLICLIFGHRPVVVQGKPPGSKYPRNWTVNWHYRCTRCKAVR